MGVSERLRQVREHLGLSQKAMAGRFGLGDSTWQKHELQGKLPGDEVLAGLHKLGIDLNWLVTGQGQMLQGDASGDRRLPSDGISREIVYNVAYHIATKNKVGAKPDAFADLVIELCDYLTDAVRKGTPVDANVTANVFDFAAQRLAKSGGGS